VAGRGPQGEEGRRERDMKEESGGWKMEGMERKRTLPPCKNCSGAMVSHSLCCWQFALAVREGLS